MKVDSKYLVGLDFLRFLLSVSILIVHFPHFISPFVNSKENGVIILPFQNSLHLLYDYGGFAVEIFWMVSGIIFYHFYRDAISRRQISLQKFVLLRLSRLYPLHLLTLVLVAFLQYVYTQRHHTNFVYSNNDFIHFILNFFMVNFWNPKFGLSFNGPFWSVSAELFVYLVFFIAAFVHLLNTRKNIFLLVVIAFGFYSLGILSPFYECILYFFAGCLLMNTIQKLSLQQILIPCILLPALFWIKYETDWLPQNIYIVKAFDCIIKLIISFCIVVIFCKMFSSANSRIQKIARTIGNMTYAIYMLHFSIQLVFMLWFYNNGYSFFNNETFFITYILIAITVGYLSYRFFELPVQILLRQMNKNVKKTDSVPRTQF